MAPLHAGILIPTFNRVDYLRTSLASAMAQTYPHLEIIVIDNGSEDGTAGYMSSIADGRVRYVVNPENIGVSRSINRGIGLFSDRVSWCTVLCDDDLIATDYVRVVLSRVESAAARSIVDSRRVFIGERGDRLRTARPAPPAVSALDYIRSRTWFARETYLTGVFFNRGAFNDIGGYPCFTTGAATDDAFIFALSLRDKLHYAPDATVYIRIHGQAESRRASEAIRHLYATAEFESYVMGMAERHPGVAPRDLLKLKQQLQVYVAMTNDILWNARVAGLTAEGHIRGNGDIDEMIALAGARGFAFTARTRANAFLLRTAGLFLETFLPYRLFWRGVKFLQILSLRPPAS